MTETERTARVLVVDDERAVADLYATWLGDEHDLVTAYDGDQALERIDDSVDVVFLDRQMPGTSGDDVLDAIAERELDCRVVMVTAVDPGFDIVEMPFDDYLTKPVTRTELTDSLEEMCTRDAYDAEIRGYYSLVSKKATLEAQKSPTELDESDAYATVCRRVDERRREVDATAARLDSFDTLLQELPGNH